MQAMLTQRISPAGHSCVHSCVHSVVAGAGLSSRDNKHRSQCSWHGLHCSLYNWTAGNPRPYKPRCCPVSERL